MRQREFLSILLSAVLMVSCGKKEDNQDRQAANLNAASGMDIQTVEVIDEHGIRQLVAERKGKALFLNVWATWCKPCEEEFPDIVRLANELSGNEVEFVGISVDYPDEVETNILPFLREQKVPFKIYVADQKDQEDFINALNPQWNGGIPLTLIYDATGKQQAMFVGLQSYETFKKAVMKLQRTS